MEKASVPYEIIDVSRYFCGNPLCRGVSVVSNTCINFFPLVHMSRPHRNLNFTDSILFCFACKGRDGAFISEPYVLVHPMNREHITWKRFSENVTSSCREAWDIVVILYEISDKKQCLIRDEPDFELACKEARRADKTPEFMVLVKDKPKKPEAPKKEQAIPLSPQSDISIDP